MRAETFRLAAGDGVELFVHRWEPAFAWPRGVVQITHGLGEHAGRYARTAARLVAAGYAVYAADLRGHGRTAASRADLGWCAPTQGWQRLVDDVHRVRCRIRADHPMLPVVLLGHSLGSFLAQSYVAEHGAGLAGVVLSGTNAGGARLAPVARALLEVERRRVGPRGRSLVPELWTFLGYNWRFHPARTEFDWLTRDEEEVDRYLADPLCGFVCTVGAWGDILDGVQRIARADVLRRVPRGLPVYLFSGEDDPVGEYTAGVRALVAAYARAGLRNVTYRFYPKGRHEMLNEINRDEVHDDLLWWLDAVVERREAA